MQLNDSIHPVDVNRISSIIKPFKMSIFNSFLFSLLFISLMSAQTPAIEKSIEFVPIDEFVPVDQNGKILSQNTVRKIVMSQKIKTFQDDLLISRCATADLSNSITGLVFDDKNNPLSEVLFSIVDSRNKTLSDLKGRFCIPLEEWPMTIVIEKKGFEPQVYLITETYSLEIIMEPELK